MFGAGNLLVSDLLHPHRAGRFRIEEIHYGVILKGLDAIVRQICKFVRLALKQVLEKACLRWRVLLAEHQHIHLEAWFSGTQLQQLPVSVRRGIRDEVIGEQGYKSHQNNEDRGRHPQFILAETLPSQCAR